MCKKKHHKKSKLKYRYIVYGYLLIAQVNLLPYCPLSVSQSTTVLKFVWYNNYRNVSTIRLIEIVHIVFEFLLF